MILLDTFSSLVILPVMGVEVLFSQLYCFDSRTHFADLGSIPFTYLALFLLATMSFGARG